MEILDSAIPLSRPVLAPKDEIVEKSSPLRGAAEQIYEESLSIAAGISGRELPFQSY